MKPFAYNPSIVCHHGITLFSYRWHPNPSKWRTKLCISDAQYEQELSFPEPYSEMSQEDARFFEYQGRLFMSFTLSVFPGNPNSIVPCSQGYAELALSSKVDNWWNVGDVKIPRYGNNNFQGQEKNFVFFEGP